MSRPTVNAYVQTYRGWLKHGRQVRKGERAYKGLFHITHTDVIDDKPDAEDPQRHATRPIASQQADWDRDRKVTVDYETGKLWLERFRR